MSCLSPYQISSFTKHIVDNKLSSAYQAEADYEACLVQSGFHKGDEWFVPEAAIEISDERKQEWELLLLPQITEWRLQTRRANGDRSECAKNFLNCTVPFLVEVFIQCGIYFILDFPVHPMAQLLLQLPGYEQWANQQRIACAQMRTDRSVDSMRNMEAATRGSFERLCQRIDSADARVNQLERLLDRVIEQNQVLVHEIRGMAAVQEEVMATVRQQQQQQPAVLVAPTAPGAARRPSSQEATQALNHDEDESPAQPPPVAAPPSTRTVAQALHQASRPRVPMIQLRMPTSFNEVWQEWEKNDLASFRNTRKASELWSVRVYHAWNRRNKIIDTIQKKATAANVSFSQQLRNIEADREERNLTASQVLQEWRDQERAEGVAGSRKSPTNPRGRKQGTKRRRIEEPQAAEEVVRAPPAPPPQPTTAAAAAVTAPPARARARGPRPQLEAQEAAAPPPRPQAAARAAQAARAARPWTAAPPLLPPAPPTRLPAIRQAPPAPPPVLPPPPLPPYRGGLSLHRLDAMADAEHGPAIDAEFERRRRLIFERGAERRILKNQEATTAGPNRGLEMLARMVGDGGAERRVDNQEATTAGPNRGMEMLAMVEDDRIVERELNELTQWRTTEMMRARSALRQIAARRHGGGHEQRR